MELRVSGSAKQAECDEDERRQGRIGQDRARIWRLGDWAGDWAIG